MDPKLYDEIKSIYSFLDLDKMKLLDYNKINLYKDTSYMTIDPNDFGLVIINISDKKKIQVERINVPSKYDNYKEVRILMEKYNVSDKYIQDVLITEIEKQKNNFNFDETKSNINLNVNCFPELCILCNNKIQIIKTYKNSDIDILIKCIKHPTHIFTYEEYCLKFK
ncbi:4-diphosphocytidyl-2-C-methyl-D-erythritol kinase [Alphaentomopoxvirus acuprea]|uniref:4-diphosphocytidyl-2-C-methyl-D-erythritol kinase n=1 Tax=Alphaentomopoxvirus acuprea TaxID=62099 RepID=W6JPK8_9POXV|nr:4-diphosphocytidyl-2-C-methyl-D-erythritol kinase [Anomala cuprea entomopoxvirus]BAO49454.1 4-diphosphocytidyl-2-C-methyl-D-erythritol kinase [Anomala cuprea entomopoxvirus]